MRLAVFVGLVPLSATLQLRTRATIPGVTPAALHEFLATPSNWPLIVASSDSVRAVGAAARRRRAARRGRRGRRDLRRAAAAAALGAVDVRGGRRGRGRSHLAFEAREGLAGVARDCRMAFTIGPPTPAGGAT